jgi:hypothetical protein
MELLQVLESLSIAEYQERENFIQYFAEFEIDDWMEIDTSDEDTGNYSFQKLNKLDSIPSVNDSQDCGVFLPENAERAQKNLILSFPSSSGILEIYKGDLVLNLYESLISAGFKVGYFNRKKELVLPVIHEDVVLLRCASCSRTTHGKRTHCPVSKFQFKKVDDNMIHLYTQCSKGISNNGKTNPIYNPGNNPVNNPINDQKVRLPSIPPKCLP